MVLVSHVIGDLPLRHSTSGRPDVPGKQRQTKNACSRRHSAFLPQPSVLQSTTPLSAVPTFKN